MTARPPIVIALLCSLISCGPPAGSSAARDAHPESDDVDATQALALRAVDPDEAVATAAIAALRAEGPAGLAALLEAHASDVARLRSEPITGTAAQLAALRDDPALARLRTAIDSVAAQRDAFASRLYWTTDLDAVRAEAARSGRPILSLRLLGRLDEELSCANSRFFRWLLYPSPEVQRTLAGYVLHWSSERPAPHITIDMGDGRTLERTITGNSVHYVLDASGRVIDAITGLSSVAQFVSRLEEARAIAETCGVRFADRACLATEHRRLADRTRDEWTGLGASVPSWDVLTAPVATPTQPSAVVAMPLAIGKMSIEAPMLRLLAPTPIAAPVDPIDWASVARLRTRPAASMVVTPEATTLSRLKTGSLDDTALVQATYERVLTDGARNRFTHERRFHDWMADPSVDVTLATLNERVYTELFLTPASDPWLGLRSDTDWDVLEVTAATGGRN